MTASVRIHEIPYGGAALAVRETGGDGPPILLVHGNSGSGAAFQRQLEGELGRRFRLLAVDLPGHGASARAADPVTGYTLPGHAAALLAVAEALGSEDAVFAGWSLGGHVVLEAAPHLPRAAGFCIFGAPPVGKPPAMDRAFLPNPAMAAAFTEAPSEAEMRALIDSWMRPGTAPPEAFCEDFRRADGRARATLGASVESLDFADEVAIVRSLDRPLAVLHGAHEQLVSLAYVEALEMPTLWRGAVQVLPDAGHAIQWESPEVFEALLGDFVRHCQEVKDR